MTTIPDVSTPQALIAFRGDTWRRPMDFAFVTGDLTGCTLELTVKLHTTDADSAALVRIKTGDTTQGRVTQLTATSAEFVINAVVMATLPNKTLCYDVQIVLATGEVRTAAWGAFTVKPDVTLAQS